eukprot:TRINITY_DN1513_c2_g2_i1.p1 TRINITY_DN1513_c2_g2~~TRINITY_DN1513_c2_g2_i1.p1  ORF type:complete len:390 (+),score=55.68 TRINITY_DN1513_c2_g2_i1:74-1243(+)
MVLSRLLSVLCLGIVSTDAAKFALNSSRSDAREAFERYMDNFEATYNRPSTGSTSHLRRPESFLMQRSSLKPRGGKKEKTIAVRGLYDPILEHRGGMVPDCPKQCRVIDDTNVADAVVINPRWGDAPAEKKRNQVWVFNFWFEAPWYMGNRVQAWKTSDMASKIDWTLTFDSRSDFKQPFGYLGKRTSTAPVTKTTAKGKKKLLLWMVSSCGGARMQYFQRLRQLLGEDKVDLLGGCGKPTCPVGQNECMEKVYKDYKFYAAFENSRCKGYITEKFFRGYKHNMVPLALGGLSRKDYEALAPSDSFVHTDDFGSIEKLAEYLLKVDKDDTLYNKFFDWQSKLEPKLPKPYCDLCMELHKDPKDQIQKHTFGNLNDFWYKDTCRSEIPQI